MREILMKKSMNPHTFRLIFHTMCSPELLTPWTEVVTLSMAGHLSKVLRLVVVMHSTCHWLWESSPMLLTYVMVTMAMSLAGHQGKILSLLLICLSPAGLTLNQGPVGHVHNEHCGYGGEHVHNGVGKHSH